MLAGACIKCAWEVVWGEGGPNRLAVTARRDCIRRDSQLPIHSLVSHGLKAIEVTLPTQSRRLCRAPHGFDLLTMYNDPTTSIVRKEKQERPTAC